MHVHVSSLGNLFKLADGWGRASDNDLVTAGQVKVYVWDYLINVRSKSVKIDQTTRSSALELALPEHVNLDQDIVYFTVRTVAVTSISCWNRGDSECCRMS